MKIDFCGVFGFRFEIFGSQEKRGRSWKKKKPSRRPPLLYSIFKTFPIATNFSILLWSHMHNKSSRVAIPTSSPFHNNKVASTTDKRRFEVHVKSAHCFCLKISFQKLLSLLLFFSFSAQMWLMRFFPSITFTSSWWLFFGEGWSVFHSNESIIRKFIAFCWSTTVIEAKPKRIYIENYISPLASQ